MVILIESLRRGYSVNFAQKKQGTLIGHGGGYDVYFSGDKPPKRSLNDILAECLPVICSLTGVSASSVNYSKPKAPPKQKSVSEKQKSLF